MVTTTLGTPLADEAIRDINFFNGRLLTGGDLQREQAARRLADRRVGAAWGPGVAWGLEVSGLGALGAGAGAPAGARVKVQRGLAVSASGAVLHLATSPEVQLVAPPVEATAAVLSGFGPCGPLGGSHQVAGAGTFVLTLAPVTLAEGKAPVLALDAVNTRCTTDAHVEAVQFRLLRVNGINATGTSAPAVARLRSQLARSWLLAQPRADAHARPGGVHLPPGVLEGLSVPGLTDCDVPLALICMQGNDITFVDRWAVRRRLASDPASAAWAPWLGGRVDGVAEAQMLQFQEHMADTPAVLAEAAASALLWLPPVGFLPQGTSVAQWQRFLGAHAPAHEVPLAAADAPGVLAGALRADAIDLAAPAASAGGLRVYRITGAGVSGVSGMPGALMFVRDGRNLHHAEQVWVDGAAVGLPGVNEVQSALEVLRAGSCLHVVLRPDMALAQTLAALPEDRDLTLCFEPGLYALREPLRLRGKRRVQLHGHGARLLNVDGECALLVEACAAVQVQGLQVEGGQALRGRGELGLGLGGALTVVDTPEVELHQVQAQCAAGEGLRVAAIVVAVRSESLGAVAPARFHVADCEMKVGAGQQGLLCVNGDSITLQRNRVSALDGKRSLQRGIVVGGRQAGLVHIEGNRVRDVMCGISVGVSESSLPGDEPLSADRVVVLHNRVEVQLVDAGSGSRYGIYIGNARSVLVSANHVVRAAGPAQELPLHGLRLNGVYGPHIVVRDNLFEFTHQGIVLQTPTRPKACVWAFQCNLGLRLTAELLEVPEPLRQTVIVEHNRKVD